MGRVSDGRRDWVTCDTKARVTSCPHRVITLQATKVTNRKCRWHKWSEQEGMLKAESLPLLGSLLRIIVAPSRDSGTAVGNLIALIRIDRHMKDSVSDWGMLVMAFSLALYLSFRTTS